MERIKIIVAVCLLFFPSCKKESKGVQLFVDGRPYLLLQPDKSLEKVEFPEKKRVRYGYPVIILLEKNGIKEGKWVVFYGRKKALKLDFSSVGHPLYKVTLLKEGGGYTLAGLYGVLKDQKNWVKEVTGIDVLSGFVKEEIVEHPSKNVEIYYRDKKMRELSEKDIGEGKNLKELLLESIGGQKFSSVRIYGERELRLSFEEAEEYSISITMRGDLKISRESGTGKRGQRRGRVRGVYKIIVE
jgi:hypothetical protein